MRYTMALIVFATLLVGTRGVSAQKDSENAALESLVTRLIAAQTGYDAVALDRLLTADYIEVSPLGEVDPRDKVLSFYEPANKPPAAKMSAAVVPSEFSIRRFDSAAIVIVRLTTTVTIDGKAQPARSMRATFVCRKDQAGWKIASAHYVAIRAAA